MNTKLDLINHQLVFKTIRTFLCAVMLLTLGLHQLTLHAVTGPRSSTAAIDVSPDGELLLLFMPGGRGFELLNTVTGERAVVSDRPQTGYYATISPDKKYVCFKDFQNVNGELLQVAALYEIATKKTIALCQPALLVGNPATSDAGTIAYTVGQQLFVLRPNLTVSTKFKLPVAANLLTFAPGGRRLAFNDDGEKVSILDLASGRISAIPAAKLAGFKPRFSPNGQSLLAQSANGQITAFQPGTGVSRKFGTARSAAWIDSDTVALVKKTVENFTVTSTEVVKGKLSDGSTSVIISKKGDAECAVNATALAVIATDGLSLSDARTGSLQRKPAFLARPEPVVSVGSPKSATSTVTKSTVVTNTSTVQITGVPYIHQLYDTADDFNGNACCNATAALMAMQYYGVLPQHPITCSSGGTHTSLYGFYISEIYTYNGHTYNIPSSSTWGSEYAGEYGGFGYFLQDNPGTSGGRSTRLSEWVSYHTMTSGTDNTTTIAKVKTEINNNNPLVILCSITSSGHYITCIGYYKSVNSLIFNDPYGNKAIAYPGWDGDGAVYDWPGSNNGHPNLVVADRFVYTRGVTPSISTQPTSRTVNVGANTTFSVTASGTANLKYQWRFNGANISGATSSAYTRSSVQASHAGSYSCVVTNIKGSVTSANAILTVNVPPSITTQPASQAVNAGANVTFSVVAAGTAPLSYQWRKNGSNISGATTSAYTKTGVQSTDAGSYSVAVTNVAGTVTSSDAVLTVNAAPAITTQPVSQTKYEGDTATFTVVATGASPLSYQWRKNGANISGATTSAYSKTSLQSSDAASYSVVVTNSLGSVTSANAVLTILANLPPSITTQPVSQTVAAGANVTFSVTATGSLPMTYQWTLNGINIAGATSSSYTKAGAQASDLGYYAVLISNAYGSAVSANATLSFSSAVAFSDDFEVGNMNNWTVCASPATALAASSTQKHAGTYSAYLNDSLDKMYHNLTAPISGHTKITVWMYDATGGADNTGQTRCFAEGRCYSGGGYANGSLNQLFAIGRYTVGFGTGTGTLAAEVVDTTRYQGRVLSGANTGWFNLTGAATRTVGWHKFEIERLSDGTTVNFYCDGVLGRQITGVNNFPIDDICIGSLGSGTALTADAFFDDVKAEYFDAPTITSQPQSQTVSSGTTVIFTVTATGAAQSYQWRYNGASIAGASTSALVLSNVQTDNSGTYDVVVANGIGPVTSSGATLTVTGSSPPSITTQPQSQTVVQGSDAIFTVVAVGTGPLSYQWTFNGADISGATDSTYAKTSAQTTDGGSYAVVVSNAYGNVTSADAILTVTVPPSITTQPISQTVNQGSSVTFTVAATGTAPLSYQWKFNGANISSATGSAYTKSGVLGSDAGSYSVLVSNTAGNITSANAILTVNIPPAISTQPASQSVAAGATVTFTVTATGTAPLSFQWRFNAADIAGATASSFSKSNVQLSDAGSYSVVVANMAGSVTSANAVLTVNAAPTLSLGSSRNAEQVVTFESIVNYNNDNVMFRKPANSSTTSSFIDTNASNFSQVITNGFPAGNPTGSGSKVFKVGWTFKTGTTNAWLRLTTANPAVIPNPVFGFAGRIRFDVYSDKSIRLGVALRETGGTVAIGGNGGTTGAIEWVGVTNKNGSMPLPSRTINASNWTTVEFDLANEDCLSFNAGNNVLDGAQGVLEHLAILPNAGLTAYTMYLDNFQMITTTALPSSVTMNSGSTLTFTAAGTDPNAGQTLTYSLVSPPTGATINSTTGAFTWTPGSGGTTNTITVRVTDNGTPAQNATESFTAIVNTDPLGVQSVESTVTVSDEAINLSWPTVAGAIYQVQYKAAVGEWTNLGEPVVGAGSEESVEINGADETTSYRIIDLSSSGADQ